MSRKKRLEAKLTPQKRKAALLLAENELMATSDKKTQEELADEIGVCRTTLYKWRTRDRVFIDYMNEVADEMLSSHRAEVYASLLKLIRGTTNGAPSVKAIDTYLKRFGLLTDRQVVETDIVDDSRSDEDIEKEIAELDDLLDDDGDEEV